MLKVSIILALLVAVQAGNQCGVIQQIMVKTQWAQAYNEGLSREAFGQAIWRAVFAQRPDARELFDRVRGDNTLSPEFQAHSMRVLGGLDMVFSLMEDDSVFESSLAHLNAQHDRMKIDGSYFGVLGNAVIQAARASIGQCFDEDAWNACFRRVASGIM